MDVVVIDLKNKTVETVKLSPVEKKSIDDEHNSQSNRVKNEIKREKKRKFAERFFDVIEGHKKRGTKPRDMNDLMSELFQQMDDLEGDDGN